jgi:AcrR family transcriptional regulator
MEEVARNAGVSRGSVYRYFPERAELIDAVLERAAERFVAQTRPAVERRRTLAAQVGEAAAFIRAHLHDGMMALQLPAEHETLLATLLTVRVRGLVDRWVTLLAALSRGSSGARRGPTGTRSSRGSGVDCASPALPRSDAVRVVDLDEPAAERAFVRKYIVKGLGG